ncbi:MAG: restriction endonuclease subunit S [Bacteroidia bacterium]|nr:restriction endonuclease subunit S [Bacteroidia bacterium]
MSWKKVKLGDICTIKKGAVGIQKAIPGEYPMVVTGEERKSHNEFQFDDEAVLIPLVSGTGHGHASIKRIHFQKGKFALGSILCAVIPKNKEQVSAEYLYRFLDLNKEDELVARMKGMANVTLPIKEIAQIEIPLPTLKEQKEFVEKYKDLEIKSDLLSTEVNHQLSLVYKLRKQLLLDAIQGNLVEQNAKEEPASELLKRIKAEIIKLIKEGKLKKETELPPIKLEEIPFEIPENWVWCRIGDISQHNSGKTLDSGRNKGQSRECITTSNLYWGYFELDNLKQILIEESELERCTAIKGDLLICEGGEAGRSAIWNSDSVICFQNHIHRVRLYGKISSNCIYWYFLYLNLSGEINKYRKGMGISNLSGKSLSSIPIPLPPLSEQHRIVQKLEQLMQTCNELEESIKQSALQNEKLLQQVLRESLKKEEVVNVV